MSRPPPDLFLGRRPVGGRPNDISLSRPRYVTTVCGRWPDGRKNFVATHIFRGLAECAGALVESRGALVESRGALSVSSIGQSENVLSRRAVMKVADG